MEAVLQAIVQIIELLTKHANEVSAPIDASQVLARMATNATEFSFDAENGQTFDRWFRQHEDMFMREANNLDDAALTRFLVRMLDYRCNERYRQSILPKLPRDFSFAETVRILNRIFGTHTPNGTAKPDVTLIGELQHPMYTSHDVQERIHQQKLPRTTKISSSLHDPDLSPQREEKPKAKSREIIRIATRSKKRKFVPVNNGVAMQPQLNTVGDTTLTQPGSQTPSINTILPTTTLKFARPTAISLQPSNTNDKTSKFPMKTIQQYSTYSDTNSRRCVAVTTFKKVGKVKNNAFLVITDTRSSFRRVNPND